MDEFHRSLPDSFREAHCLVREALSHADKIIREADFLASRIAPQASETTQLPQMTAKRANWLFGRHMIGLEKVLPSALAAFKAVEVPLLRVADPYCEHQQALEFAEEVRHAITLTAQLYDPSEVTFANIGQQLTKEWEHVWKTLGFVERIDVGQLYKRMRREIVRAVDVHDRVQPRDATTANSVTTESGQSGDKRKASEVKEPSREERQAFALWMSGLTQAVIAKRVFGSETKQYKVSRAKTTVEKFLRSIGVPEENWKQEAEKPEFITMEPNKIDLGKRVDPHTPRQRDRIDDSE